MPGHNPFSHSILLPLIQGLPWFLSFVTRLECVWQKEWSLYFWQLLLLLCHESRRSDDFQCFQCHGCMSNVYAMVAKNPMFSSVPVNDCWLISYFRGPTDGVQSTHFQAHMRLRRTGTGTTAETELMKLQAEPPKACR